MELYRSWRESPKVPLGWKPKSAPRHRLKLTVKNRELLALLRSHRPGRWHKIYHYGIDGSEIHYFEHQSGVVFDVEHHSR